MLSKNKYVIEINKIFYSEKLGSMHNKCVFCEENVLEYEHGYVIEKAFKYNEISEKYETVFEYVLCTECMHRLSSEMSEKSKKNIEVYFNENRKNIVHPNDRFEKCMITNDNVKSLKEYQIAGLFYKTKMLISKDFPYAIGLNAINEVQELISEKTRNFSEKFKDLILPPHVKDNIPKDRIVIF